MIANNNHIAIIGAGPAGLAVAGLCSSKDLDYTLLEKADTVAPMWHKHYDRLHLHTVRKYSSLPLYPIPDKYPTYLSKYQVVEYMEEYKTHFNIQPQFNTKIESITKENNQWKITTSQGVNKCNIVVLCTGVNRVPYYPHWTGFNRDTNNISHSRNYKNPEHFEGKKVLVIGMGNTGAEIALDLAEHNIETDISVRSVLNIAPRDIMGRPSQVSAKMLAKLPLGIGDSIGKFVKNVAVGDLSKYGLKTTKESAVKHLLETGKTPVLDLGTVKKIKEGKIKVQQGIDSFDDLTVNFKNGVSKKYDKIILATGYRAKLEELIPGIESQFNKDALPISWKGSDQFSSMYFCGFDNYKLGGILGTIYDDSLKIINDI